MEPPGKAIQKKVLLGNPASGLPTPPDTNKDPPAVDDLVFEAPISIIRPPELLHGLGMNFEPAGGHKGGGVAQLGSPKRLTSENLEKHRKGHQKLKADSRWKPPPPTANDRLRQARNFLSDEDVYLDSEFASRVERIDRFLLQRLAKEKIACDVRLYDEVQAMVKLHLSRMNGEKTQKIELPKSNPGPLQSQRLSRVDTSKQGYLLGAPLRDDHPPFTLERPADQNLFIKALHGPPAPTQDGGKDRRIELLKIEGDGFLEVLKNPALVHEWIEESESQTREAMFNARARRRGRRRAVTRLALRAFATNCEQHYEGRWQEPAFRLPSAPALNDSNTGNIFAGNENVSKDSGPFQWTQKYLDLIRLRKAKPKVENDRSLQELAQPLNDNLPIPTEEQALSLLRAEMLKEHQDSRQLPEATSDTKWATQLPEPGQTQQYFSLGRWSGIAPPAPEESRKRTREDPSEGLPPPKRQHYAVAYERLDGSKGLPSKRLPLEQLDYREIREDSRERTPPRGTGALIPRAIKQFNFGLDGHVMEDARDPKVTEYPGGESSFNFGETSFVQATMSKWIESDLNPGNCVLS